MHLAKQVFFQCCFRLFEFGSIAAIFTGDCENTKRYRKCVRKSKPHIEGLQADLECMPREEDVDWRYAIGSSKCPLIKKALDAMQK